MRLLNVHTLVISEFYGNQIPRYAILSHTWDEEEVTLQDMIEGRALFRRGYQKIASCCEQARFDGLPYVWIDTCCIDKRSSAELSEAINSMYRWYENATLCYAYLADVDGEQCDSMASFKSSRYWTRGWTLQELIAPNIVIFFSSGWSRIGSRHDLRQVVSEATSIPTEVLRYRVASHYSVSQKMSWASRRRTTRIEDEAYCLLGLFGVAMPLLYGEGRRAFLRLQEEIIKVVDDESIFAWQGGTDHGLLASCPAQFTFSHSIRRSIDHPIGGTTSDLPFAITNRGVRISLPILEDFHTIPLYSLIWGSVMKYQIPDPTHLQHEARKRVLAVFHCQSTTDASSRIAVILNYDMTRDSYTRDVNMGLVRVSINDTKERTTLRQILVTTGSDPWDDVALIEEDPGRLVAIQGLSGPITNLKFEHTTLVNGTNIRSDLQENGTVSFRFHQGRQIAVIYRDGNSSKSHYLIIYLKLLDSKAHIHGAITHIYGQDTNKDDILKQTAQFSQDFLSGQQFNEIVYEAAGETCTLSLDIRETEHASIVKVNAKLQAHSELDPTSD
ncbi:heterokaryon incompatibility protein-domain-containing protein [Xylaria venustula]|nr:heterokaryon incompatibility protein-domain-containing protein [Xylaria venustula]